MRRQWLNSIVTLLMLVSCSSVFGQELHDYRYYKLFEEPSFYNTVMEEMGRAMYFNLKNGE